MGRNSSHPGVEEVRVKQ